MSPSLRAAVSLFSLLVLSSACGGDAAATETGKAAAGGAGGTVGTAGATGMPGLAGSSGSSSAGMAGSGGSGPTSCPVAPEPANLATVPAVFALQDPANGVVVPLPTGGDPTGTWTITKSTVFLPDIAMGIVDPTMSTSSGSGFFAFEGSKYRLRFHTESHLVATSGDIDSVSDTQSTGTYTLGASVLTVSPNCLVVTGDSGTDASIGYSVVGDTLQTITLLITPQGNSTVVTEAVRVK